MIRFWDYISDLGINGKTGGLDSRAIIMANRLNVVLGGTMLVLSCITTYIIFEKDQEFTFYTSRLILLLIVNLLNLTMSRFGLIKMMQLSTSLSPVTILIIIPLLLGYVQDSSFFYYHIIVIGISVIPQLVFVPKVDNFFYWFSMGLFLLLILFLDNLMIDLTTSSQATIRIIEYFRIYFKIIPVAVFVYLHLALFYMRNVNISFEGDLVGLNKRLNSMNHRLELMVEERTKDLEVKNKKLAEYAFTNAHELRAPIANLLGLLQHLEEVDTEEETRRCVSLLKSAASQLNEITFEIRDRLVSEGYSAE